MFSRFRSGLSAGQANRAVPPNSEAIAANRACASARVRSLSAWRFRAAVRLASDGTFLGLDRVTTRFALFDSHRGVRAPARPSAIPVALRSQPARPNARQLPPDGLGPRRTASNRSLLPRPSRQARKERCPARPRAGAASASTRTDRIGGEPRSEPARRKLPEARRDRVPYATGFRVAHEMLCCVSCDARHRSLEQFALCETLTRIGAGPCACGQLSALSPS